MENAVYTVICSETENGHESMSVCGVCRSVRGAVDVVHERMEMRFRHLLAAGIPTETVKVENRENDFGGQFSMEYGSGNRVAWYVAEMELQD